MLTVIKQLKEKEERWIRRKIELQKDKDAKSNKLANVICSFTILVNFHGTMEWKY